MYKGGGGIISVGGPLHLSGNDRAPVRFAPLHPHGTVQRTVPAFPIQPGHFGGIDGRMTNVIFGGFQSDLTEESVDGGHRFLTRPGGDKVRDVDQDDSPVLVFGDEG